jgi:hypothetical protein
MISCVADTVKKMGRDRFSVKVRPIQMPYSSVRNTDPTGVWVNPPPPGAREGGLDSPIDTYRDSFTNGVQRGAVARARCWLPAPFRSRDVGWVINVCRQARYVGIWR